MYYVQLTSVVAGVGLVRATWGRWLALHDYP